MTALSLEVHASAFYRGSDKELHNLSAWIAIDPEGVTEEDVQRLHHEAMKHLSMTQEVFIEPILILVQGGKV